MKKFFAIFAILVMSVAAFSQTRVDEKKLGKTLEKNENPDTVFISEIDLSKINVSENGAVSIPLLKKNKISVVSEMDMTGINERIAYSRRKKFQVTFTMKNLKPKVYAITDIQGIESASEYKNRLAEDEKIRREKERRENLAKMPVQVVNQEAVNLSASETAWLPGQIQDKLKSNLQEFLGMKTVVDSKSEAALKKLQMESENGGRDESTAIELGKITTAKFALFTKIRKTGSGYTISVDFTDLTTGEQLASVISKEYSSSEYLYGTTGAIDEITLALGNKLGINISELNKNLLTSGSSSFSVDEQIQLAKRNEDNFKKMMEQYDAELARLSLSNDLSSIENKKKIEAEKAILVEKQNAEKKRQAELAEQKKRAEADARLEAERSIALKTQRDEMAKQAVEKAAEVRKLKMEKQGVLGQISVIESKKKALVEIRQNVETRCEELYWQLANDRDDEEQRIRNKSYSTVELGSDGMPTAQAKARREKQIVKSYEDLTNKFFANAESVRQSTMTQQNALLTEIRTDQKALATTRTVSSLGDELKISFGTYDGAKNGWNTYISLYSEGVLLYTDNFIVSYKALSGKSAPVMERELNDDVIEEYTNNVDMYNSLLVRGDPIIYFELDYNVNAESDGKPSQYNFKFQKIRVINTLSGKVTQTSTLNKIKTRTMEPAQDLREFAGVVEKEKVEFDKAKYPLENYMVEKGYCKTDAEIQVQNDIKIEKLFGNIGNSKMIKIPGKDYELLNTEVTQRLYTEIMGENPSYFKDTNNPVENVSWYDAIYFCNKLSTKLGLTPVYSVNGTTDVTKWGYTPHRKNVINGTITQNINANGFRLPTEDEWEYAARGGQKYRYAGSNNLDEVGWYAYNSGGVRECKTHPVAMKKSNGYGLYDMSGNVSEWVWGTSTYSDHFSKGGSYCDWVPNYYYSYDNDPFGVSHRYCYFAGDPNYCTGFRLLRQR